MAQTSKTATGRASTASAAATSSRSNGSASNGSASNGSVPNGSTTRGSASRGAVAEAPAPRRPAANKAVSARSLKVREGESPWTTAELSEVRSELEEDEERLRREIAIAEHDLASMLRDAGDGAGDDQADAGSKTFEREQEMSLANNARDMLVQIGHAIQRMHDGTYGCCESCGNAVGKARLQAFPRATLCLTCKQREERR